MIGRGRERSFALRRGRTDPIVVVLLAGILVALVVLIGILVTHLPIRTGDQTASGAGPTSLPPPPPPPRPKPIGDPERIRETLQAGKTYHLLVKATFKARVEDKAWGVTKMVSLAYAAEMAVDRFIESNDGHKIVERRHFITARNAKLLCDVENISIDLGRPGELLLGALGYIQPGSGGTLTMAKPIVEALLRGPTRERANTEATKAVASVNGLSGKTVRITYVDGQGVESVEPVDCTLSADQEDLIRRSAILSDCYILRDRKSKPGDTWPVDGAQLAGFLDPTLSGFPEGEVWIGRDEDEATDGKRYARLRIDRGTVTIDRTDASTQRIGSFTPRGVLRYSITDGFIESAQLTGRFDIEEVSTDHILFETRFKTHPELKVSYACSVR